MSQLTSDFFKTYTMQVIHTQKDIMNICLTSFDNIIEFFTCPMRINIFLAKDITLEASEEERIKSRKWPGKNAEID